MPAPTILLVEDDVDLAGMMRTVFESEGYTVRHAATAAQARAALDAPVPDVILLDLVLPDADGLVLFTDLRARLDVPILICSGTSRKRDSVLALKLGADDFIAKPFDVDELVTRVETGLRRPRHGATAVTPAAPNAATSSAPAVAPAAPVPPAQQPTAPAGVNGSTSIGRLTLEHARRHVTFDGEEVRLTPTEYRLLAAFIAHPDEVLSRRDLANLVWGYEDASIGRSIDVHVHRLRAKLQAVQARRQVPGANVIAVRGFGYKLMSAAPAADTTVAAGTAVAA